MSGTEGLTDLQLQDAYRQMRRPDWPSLQEIKAQAARWRLIEGQALRLARGYRAPAPQESAPAATPAPHHAPPVPTHPPLLDGKSLAAGARADD
nr:hypothetical protein [uncultured Roseateles sp.]